MTAVEIAVAFDTVILDVSVEDGFDDESAAPSIGAEHRPLGGQVRVVHVDEARVRDTQPPAVRVLEEHAARKGAVTQVQRNPVSAQGGIVRCQPLAR